MARRVLVVEDDLVLRGVLADVLAEEGMVASVAASVDEALARLRESTFDSILLDLHLGDRSGAAVLEVLANNERAPGVVAISASPRDVVVAQRFGISFVAKPFGIEAVLSALAIATRPSAPGDS